MKLILLYRYRRYSNYVVALSNRQIGNTITLPVTTPISLVNTFFLNYNYKNLYNFNVFFCAEEKIFSIKLHF